MALETIAQRLDRLANDTTAAPFASIPTPSGPRKDLSYRQFANIVNTAALWLDGNLQGHDTSFEPSTFAYNGTIDLCRYVLLIAAAKTGRKVCEACHAPGSY